jgi:pimeloyl-ACP methyl ester carboxylesterase
MTTPDGGRFDDEPSNIIPNAKGLRSKHIRLGKLNIRYFQGGQGDPLVVVHGGGGGADTWLSNAENLSKKYTVYVPDLPGFGLSQAMEGDFEIARYAHFIEEFVAAVGLKSFNLMGHSLGGGIAGTYAIKHPQRVRKLVLVDSLGLGKEIAMWARVSCWMLGSAVRATLQAIRFLAKLLYSPLESLRAISGFSVGVGRSLMTLQGQKINLMEGLSQLLVPTLVVWGKQDPVVPISHGYNAACRIPNCRLEVFQDCGHSVHIQRTEEFCYALTGFLG